MVGRCTLGRVTATRLVRASPGRSAVVGWGSWAESPPQTPAGWYPDPYHPRQRRYWDGTSWAWPTRAGTSGVVTWGWITAFLLPGIGFVLGIIAAAKSEVGNGIGIMVVSVLSFIVWSAILAGGL